MKKIKSNKGAALVSVMIAITFISIVSTTLLLISLNNYQMKVINSQSKENFYTTEQRLNVATTNIRNEIKKSTNVPNDVRTLLGGTTTNANYTTDTYKAEKIAALAFPNPDTSTTTISGSNVKVLVNPEETDPSKRVYDNYYFYGGNFEVKDRTGGKEIVVKDLKVKQVNASGYENTIKTDLNFYVQIPEGGSGGGGGIGSCSFILDSTLELCSGNTNGDKSTRLNVYGNTIFGKYTLVTSGSYSTDFINGSQLSTPQELTKYSTPVMCTKTYQTGTKTVSKVTNKDKAIIYLREFSSMNFLSDTNVVLGDVYLDDQALLNVLDGSFTCYGDIFIAKSAAFVCNGTLNLGVNSHIYSVDNNGNCTLITTSTPAKNAIFGTVNQLDKINYDKICDHLKLFDDEAINDGILPNILIQATSIPNSEAVDLIYYKSEWNGSANVLTQKNDPKSGLAGGGNISMYCYDLQDAFSKLSADMCTFDGISYRVAVPAGNLNNGYSNELILVNSHTEGDGKIRITQNIPNSTIISKNPVYCYDTHGVCVSKMGDLAFNYITDAENDCRMNLQSSNGAKLKQFCIADFFDENANPYVSTVFNLSAGEDTSGGPTKPTKILINYSSWAKDIN